MYLLIPCIGDLLLLFLDGDYCRFRLHYHLVTCGIASAQRALPAPTDKPIRADATDVASCCGFVAASELAVRDVVQTHTARVLALFCRFEINRRRGMMNGSSSRWSVVVVAGGGVIGQRESCHPPEEFRATQVSILRRPVYLFSLVVPVRRVVIVIVVVVPSSYVITTMILSAIWHS